MNPLCLPTAPAGALSFPVAAAFLRRLLAKPAFQFNARAGTSLMLMVALFAGGCASNPTGPCETLACFKRQAVQPIYEACVSDLFHQDLMSKREQARVKQQYHYPLTNAATFFELSGAAPSASPNAWCRRYTDRFTQLSVTNVKP